MTSIFHRLQARFAFSDQELMNYINTAPYRYKTYNIPKRSGGVREISQPSRDLKSVQRFVLSEFLLPKLEYHDCATAYREGRNISNNARPHLRHPYLLKMDFQNFFPSIQSSDFTKYLLESSMVEDRVEAVMLSRLFFKYTTDGLRLTIGSPGSPPISNALLMNFDNEVSAMCSNAGVTFTRYSDDLTFSTDIKGALFDIPMQVEELLGRMKNPSLSINPEKTKFSSKKFNRHVTGITISNDGLMSLGRKTKRSVRSKVFNAPSMQPKDLQSLRGYLSFAKQIEPQFIERLIQKYPSQMRMIEGAPFTKRNGDPM